MSTTNTQENITKGSTQKWLILMLDPPYTQPLLDHRIQIINNLAKTASKMVLFFYMDGIHQLNSNQIPKNFTNIQKKLTDLHHNYPTFQFMACSRCTGARGYLDIASSNLEKNKYISKKLLSFVEIVSIRKFGQLLRQDYNFLQL